MAADAELTELEAVQVLAELLDNRVGGQLVAEQDGQPVDVIVCCACDDNHPLLRLDHDIADCADCGRRVQFAPDRPSGGRRLCVWCALTLAKQGVQ